MNELVLANRAADWTRLKSLVLDSVSSPITKRVYDHALDEFFAWFGQEPRPGFTKATVAAWRVALEGADSGPSPSTCGSQRCGNWRSKPPITGCWRRNCQTASRGCGAWLQRASGSGTGLPPSRPRRS